jgi:hypothetical protein
MTGWPELVPGNDIGLLPLHSIAMAQISKPHTYREQVRTKFIIGIACLLNHIIYSLWN